MSRKPKKAGKVVTDSEQRFVTKFFAGKLDEPQLVVWVVKRKRKKVHSRLLGIGKYRIVSIKSGNKVVRDGHLYDLQEIKSSSDADQFVLCFPDFVIDITTPQAQEIIQLIRSNRAACSPNFSGADHLMMSYTPESALLPLIEHSPSICDGFLDAYRGWSNYYELPPSSVFETFVSDLHNIDKRGLDLGECPGIEPGTNYTFDLRPIARAMRHNTYFLGFSLNNVPRKDIASLVAETMETNTNLICLSLRNVGASDGFAELGEALKANVGNRLAEIDLSHNKVGDKGLVGLAGGISLMSHPLQKLILENCGLQPNGIQALAQAFQANPTASHGLEVLNLSRNNIGVTGSQNLSLWLNQLQDQQTRLAEVLVSDSSIDVPSLVYGIGVGISHSIRVLDISHTRLAVDGASAIATVLVATASLDYINCSHMRMTGQSLETIVSNCAINTQWASSGGHLHLDLRCNEMGSQRANVESLCRSLGQLKNIDTLVLRENGFKSDAIVPILESLSQEPGIENGILDLDIGAQPKASAGKHKPACTLLGQMVMFHQTLTTLSLQGDVKNGLYFGKDLVEFFPSLKNNPNLTELDISYNRFGDEAATVLADALRDNTNLLVLRWDGNEIELGGWQALKSCLLSKNDTLCEVDPSTEDRDRALKVIGDGSAAQNIRKKIEDSLGAIQNAAEQNRAKNPSFATRRSGLERFDNTRENNDETNIQIPLSPRGGPSTPRGQTQTDYSGAQNSPDMGRSGTVASYGSPAATPPPIARTATVNSYNSGAASFRADSFSSQGSGESYRSQPAPPPPLASTVGHDSYRPQPTPPPEAVTPQPPPPVPAVGSSYREQPPPPPAAVHSSYREQPLSRRLS